MTMIKTAVIMVLVVFAYLPAVRFAHAEEGAKGSVYSPNEAIMHIEMAKVEISKSDFMPPSQHISAARAAAEKVTGNQDIVKKATASIIQAQIKVKEGDIKGATAELDKALALYKSL